LADPNITFHNAAELLTDPASEGALLSRVPNKLRIKLNEKAQRRALNGSGMELRFNLEGEEAAVYLMQEPTGGIAPKGIVELYQGSLQSFYEMTPQLVGTEPTRIVVRRLDKHRELLQEKYRRGELAFDPDLIRILLPQDTTIRFLRTEGNISPARPEQLPSLRYLAHGSSITYGADAGLPSAGYAAATARRLGADLINLGMAGSCYLEEAMADYIAERQDWDFATLELGINVIGFMPPEEFERRVDYFLKRIAGSHPDKWVFCTDIFTSHNDFNPSSPVHEFRRIVKRKVAEQKLPRLIHIPGQELLPDIRGLSADLLHPSAEGMQTIANNLAARMGKLLNLNLTL
jgi:lysophospholipase L1-like esterase